MVVMSCFILLSSEITETRAEIPMPNGISDTSLADDFADYLMDKISNIWNSPNGFEKHKPLTKKRTGDNSFRRINRKKKSSYLSLNLTPRLANWCPSYARVK